MYRSNYYERGYENVIDLITNALEQWVADALLDPDAYKVPYQRGEAQEIKAQAIADFEKAKLDPEGCPLLNRAVFVMNIMYDEGKTSVHLTEADVLDTLLERAGLPWDIQPAEQLQPLDLTKSEVEIDAGVEKRAA
jgi:hypothetical protein